MLLLPELISCRLDPFPVRVHVLLLLAPFFLLSVLDLLSVTSEMKRMSHDQGNRLQRLEIPLFIVPVYVSAFTLLFLWARIAFDQFSCGLYNFLFSDGPSRVSIHIVGVIRFLHTNERNKP